MEYRKSGNTMVVRLDENDEVMESILMVCEKEGVRTASVSAIGALKQVELSHFDSVTNEYTSKSYEGMFEITSLTGNISRLDGKSAAHLHINLGRTDLSVFGGHLVSAIVNPTCEIFIFGTETGTSRQKDGKTGLSLLRFG